jgi:hypothetical protein
MMLKKFAHATMISGALTSVFLMINTVAHLDISTLTKMEKNHVMSQIAVATNNIAMVKIHLLALIAAMA